MQSLVIIGLGVVSALFGWFVFPQFIATRIFPLDRDFATPTHALNDGVDYLPTSKWVLVVILVLVSTGLAPAAFGLSIVINPGAALARNEAALDAFNRAANQWEAVLTDPVTVTIEADLVTILNSNIIGQAASVQLFAPYDFLRDAVVLDSLDEPDDAIVAALPTLVQFRAFLPLGFALDDSLGGTKANIKALGFPGLDATFGAADAFIEFNDQFMFDFDASDGLGTGLTDFETVASHEIGHTLGFVSIVDQVDFLLDQGQTSTAVTPRLLDLFRFADDTLFDPFDIAGFTTTPRMLLPGVEAVLDDIDNEWRFSTGAFTGDGRQASHWKDNRLTGTLIGTMDPTLGREQRFSITQADIRAFDLIGWDPAVAVPEPSSVALLSLGLLGLAWRARRR